MKKKFRSFPDARKFVRKLKLKSQNEWNLYRKSGKNPDDIPAAPHRTYKNKGWKGYGDWLGTGNIAAHLKQIRSFKEARFYVQTLALKNRKEWRAFCKLGKLPSDIPHAPEQVYRNKGWNGLGDWLGTGNIASHLKQNRNFKEARAYVRTLGIKSQREWNEFCKSGKKPDNIPSTPSKTYKNKGWVSWGDWLGNEKISNINRQYKTFKEFKKFVIPLRIKNQRDWQNFCKSGKKPHDIPAHYWDVYSKERILRKKKK